MTIRYLRRRSFLRGAAGASVALPLLDIMGCSRDSGGRTGDGPAPATDPPGSDDLAPPSSDDYDPGGELVPRRFVCLVSPNGYIDDAWFPSSSSSGGDPTETDFVLGATMASLAPLKDKLVVLRGIDNHVEPKGHNDGACSLLTGMQADIDPTTGEPAVQKLGNGPSIDWVIAQRIIAASAQAPPHLHVAVSASDKPLELHGVSYTAPRVLAARTKSPIALWNKLFGGTAGLTPAEIERRTARRTLVVDDVLDDYHQLRTKVGQADKLRLDHHLEMLEELQRRIEAVSADCAAPDAPDDGINNISHELPQMTGLFFELLRLAFACDLTRSVSYMMRTEGASANQTFGWLGLAKDGSSCNLPTDERPDCAANTPCDDNCEGIYSTNHHALSHHANNPVAREKLLVIQEWYASQLGALASVLDATTEGDGTMLDNSLCVLTSSIARGDHTLNDMKFLLAGGCGGTIPTGRFLDFRASGGMPHNALLLSFLHAMGHRDDSVFGEPEACPGPVPGLVV